MSTDRHRKIDDIAGDWLARRDSGNWSEAEQRRFEAWLNESPLHRVTYLRLEHVWERSERLKALGAGIPPGVIPPANRWNWASPFFGQRQTAPTRRAHWVRALAAGIVLATGLGGAYYFWPAASSYSTPIGGLASVPMSDGSNVTLNTDSEIRVAVTANERRIDLEHGEAFFDVAHDSKRPFIVHAGDKRVTAMGTKFAVRRDGDGIRVVVTEGKVLVQTGATDGTGSAEPVPAGAIAQASDAGILLQPQHSAEAEEALSWRQGVLVFRQMTLGEASAEFNRYNARKIVIDDPEVASMRVAGSFRANNVDAFVRLLERGYPLHVEERSDGFLLSAR